MIKRGRIFTAIVMTLFMALMPVAANAQTASLSCAGGSVSGGQLYDTGNPPGSGGACQYTGISHIVSQVVCNYSLIMNDIMGKVYCSMQYALTSILEIVLTIYVAVFGVQILLGHAQLNAREILTRLFKIILVWLFATQASWGIGFAFQFFVGIMSDGAGWVIKPALGTAAAGTTPLYGYLDTFVSGMILGPFVYANFQLIGFFVLLTHVFPTLALMAAFWFWETLCTVGRILIAFMLSMSAIGFLIVLSPIFLSLMLFQATFHFFDNWLRYLICYSLQIIVVFGIAVMWILVTVQFIGFFSDLAAMLVPYQQLLSVGDMEKPVLALGICPGTLQQMTTGPQFMPTICSTAQLIPPSQWVDQSDFMYYLLYHLISLLLLAIAFKTMMKHGPELANNIVSPGYVPPLLGGGWGTPGLIASMPRPRPIAQRRPQMQQAGQTSNSFIQQMQKMLQG